MNPEPFPDDISKLFDRVLSGKPPELDEQGRYTDGTYKGMTPAEVIREKIARQTHEAHENRRNR